MAYKRNYKRVVAPKVEQSFLTRLKDNYDIVFYVAGAFILLAYMGYPLTKSQVEITNTGGKK